MCAARLTKACCTFFFVAGALLLVAPIGLAIEPSNVLVLYNAESTDGSSIANYYAQVHPGVRTLAIHDMGLEEEISYSQYLNVLRPQVVGALDANVDVIVTTKGLPLRIDTPMTWTSFPASYTDPQGMKH